MLTQASITPNLIPKQEILESSKLDHNYENMSYSSTQQNTPIPSPAKSSSGNEKFSRPRRLQKC